MSNMLCPIDPGFANSFAKESKSAGYPHVEEKTLHVSRAWATGDVAPSTSQEASFEIFNNTSGHLVEQSQNPRLSSSSNLPSELRIAMCALACIVRLTNLSTIANVKAVQDGLERSVITMRLGGLEHLEFFGNEVMDYGPPLLVGNDGAATPVAGRLPNGIRTFRRFALPRLPGVQQQLSLKHAVSTTTAWAVAFTADYVIPALIARKSV